MKIKYLMHIVMTPKKKQASIHLTRNTVDLMDQTCFYVYWIYYVIYLELFIP